MPDTYQFTRDGVPEEVKREPWRWIAAYNDGTELRQFDDEAGRFHQFAEIDQSRLAVFKMVHDTLPEYHVPFDPRSMKLIHFYRHIRLNVGEPNEKRIKIYSFGFEQNGQKWLTYVLPDGTTVIGNDDNLVRGG